MTSAFSGMPRPARPKLSGRWVDAHHEAVFRVAYRLTNVRELAEDITQECFLRLMSNRGRFDPLP